GQPSRWHRGEGDAAVALEGGAVQSGHQEGRTHGCAQADRWAPCALLQVQRRSHRRLTGEVPRGSRRGCRNRMARLQEFYRNEVVKRLQSDLALTNPTEVPRITKITVNMGVGEAVADRKVIDAAAGDLSKITGQKPMICKARKAIASFKVREGLPIGCKVTLRGARMYEFLDRLISVAMPRIRDFRGVSPRGF